MIQIKTNRIDNKRHLFECIYKPLESNCKYKYIYSTLLKDMSTKKFKFSDDFRTRCYMQDGCIIFTGTPSAQYGRYQGEPAHRYSYRIHKGEIPKNYVIHHTCFCKRCVNPSHLKAVTVGENIRQNYVEGRMTHMNKLTPKQTIAIYKSSASEQWLADQYGVSRTTIRRIKKL